MCVPTYEVMKAHNGSKSNGVRLSSRFLFCNLNCALLHVFGIRGGTTFVISASSLVIRDTIPKLINRGSKISKIHHTLFFENCKVNSSVIMDYTMHMPNSSCAVSNHFNFTTSPTNAGRKRTRSSSLSRSENVQVLFICIVERFYSFDISLLLYITLLTFFLIENCKAFKSATF